MMSLAFLPEACANVATSAELNGRIRVENEALQV